MQLFAFVLLLAAYFFASTQAEVCSNHIDAFANCMKQKLVKVNASDTDSKSDFKRETNIRINEESFDSAWKSCLQAKPVVKIPTVSDSFDGWAVGMKLEALDRLNPTLIAVARVFDVDGNNVSITFDGWGSGFDYTTDKANADLHPIGYAMYIKHPQQTYKPYRYEGSFSWKKYLLDTETVPVPFEAFTQAQTGGMPKDFYKKMVDEDIVQPGS